MCGSKVCCAINYTPFLCFFGMEAETCEALDSKQLARRWRQLNQSPEPSVDEHQEFAWRARTSKKLSSIHTLKSIQECGFFIEDSRDAVIHLNLNSVQLYCEFSTDGRLKI
jgi:hypothetical protein